MAEQKNNYSTSLVIVIGFLFLYYFFERDWMLYVSLTVGTLSILSPFINSKIHWLWMKLGLALGWFNSKVLLSIVYFLILLPVALLAKLGRKDFLKLQKPSEESMYIERNYKFVPEDLKHPF